MVGSRRGSISGSAMLGEEGRICFSQGYHSRRVLMGEIRGPWDTRCDGDVHFYGEINIARVIDKLAGINYLFFILPMYSVTDQCQIQLTGQ